ncbi:hypothetical protein K9F62_10285 [Desulfovibrio sp. JY]|nr:hypothetical protein K9F62_10285 [Desulfovibrio sp. JY]
MKTLLPLVVDDNVLVSSSIPEDDAPAYDADTVYGVGETCVVAHQIYTSLLASNAGHSPPSSLSGTTPWWSASGYTLRWRAFDPYINTTSHADGDQTYVLAVSYCDAIAMFGLVAEAVDIEVKNTAGDVVYSETIDLLLSDPQNIEEFIYASREYNDVVWINIPMMTAAIVTITLRGSDGTDVGKIIPGESKFLGNAQWEPTIPATDYSIFDTNTFGGIYVSQGAYAVGSEGDLQIETSQLRAALRVARSLRATPTAFFCANEVHADGLSDIMIAYGLLRTYEPTIKTATMQEVSYKITGVK